MIRICRPLTLRASASRMGEFTHALKERPPAGWRLLDSPEPGLLRVERRRRRARCTLVLTQCEEQIWRASGLHVERSPAAGRFGVEQYNLLVAEFHQAFDHLAQRHGVSLQLGGDTGWLDHMLTPAARQALEDFAHAVEQKQPAQAWPWCRFISLWHASQSPLQAMEFGDWLAARGWAEDLVENWQGDFAQSHLLLVAHTQALRQASLDLFEALPPASVRVQ